MVYQKQHDVKADIQAVISTRPITSDRLDIIREAIRQDADFQTVARYIKTAWPDELSHVPHILHKFYVFRAHLSEVEDLLLFDDRMIIQLSLQKNVLSQIQEGHQG